MNLRNSPHLPKEVLTPVKLPQKRKHWTAVEDEAIKKILTETTDFKWTDIANRLQSEYFIEGRSGKQCRQRWHNHLDPSLSKIPWQLQEERTLFTSHQELGNIWAHITSLLPGRSQNAVKNHFYSSIRRQFRKFKGGEPTRHQLKKYDSILTAQLLTVVNKKIKHRENKKQQEVKEVKTLEDIDPLEFSSEESTVWGDNDYFFDILFQFMFLDL